MAGGNHLMEATLGVPMSQIILAAEQTIYGFCIVVHRHGIGDYYVRCIGLDQL